MNYTTYFRNSVCVVTGAGSGIGYALSEALLGAGSSVLLVDVSESALSDASGRLATHAGRFHVVVVDVAIAEQVSNMIEHALHHFGRIDMLFNNAGIGGTLPITEATIDHWKRIVAINLWGVIHGVQAVLPAMLRQGTGHIINTASIGGIVPVPGQALYNTTKYAVVGLSESLRYELEAQGIAVTVVCPGPVASRIWGVPILGPRVDREAPRNAITAKVAADTILRGVAQKEGIVVLPRSEKWMWRVYRCFPTLAERTLRSIAKSKDREGLAQRY